MGRREPGPWTPGVPGRRCCRSQHRRSRTACARGAGLGAVLDVRRDGGPAPRGPPQRSAWRPGRGGLPPAGLGACLACPRTLLVRRTGRQDCS
jgi:hypothetical protein